MVAKNEVYGIFMVCNEVYDFCILNATVYYITNKDELVSLLIPIGCNERFYESFEVSVNISYYIDIIHVCFPLPQHSFVFTSATWLYSTLSLYIGLSTSLCICPQNHCLNSTLR